MDELDSVIQNHIDIEDEFDIAKCYHIQIQT